MHRFSYSCIMFNKKPRRHTGPIALKAVIAIISFTLLLTAVETVIAYEINRAFGLSFNGSLIEYAIFALINSIILHRYVCVISKDNSSNPRFGCHVEIFVFSLLFIAVGVGMEHDARAKMYRAKTLNEISHTDAEYFYIDEVGILDTVKGRQRIDYRKVTPRRESAKHCFTGYYAAPFCDRKSVFYGIKYEDEYSSRKFSRSLSMQLFTQHFQDSIRRINPVVSGHLFQRTFPDNKDFLTFCHVVQADCPPQDFQYVEKLLTPMKNDRMPRWTGNLPFYAILWMIYIILLCCFFHFSKTEDSRY